jgi:hypothetical protein
MYTWNEGNDWIVCFCMSTRNRSPARYSSSETSIYWKGGEKRNKLLRLVLAKVKFHKPATLTEWKLERSYRNKKKTEWHKQTFEFRLVTYRCSLLRTYTYYFIRYGLHTATPTHLQSVCGCSRKFVWCHDTAEYSTSLLQNFLHNNQGTGKLLRCTTEQFN